MIITIIITPPSIVTELNKKRGKIEVLDPLNGYFPFWLMLPRYNKIND